MSGSSYRADIGAMSRDVAYSIDSVPPEPELIDDALHYGRAWHRYRYCYRASRSLRVLDAGCGAGRSSAWIAILNPGSRVTGVDVSSTMIDVARRNAKIPSDISSTLEFQVADLNDPLPAELADFDFVVCRKTLGEVADPSRAIRNLRNVLKSDGLLYLDLPSRRGHDAARTLRRAVDVLAVPGMSLEDRSRIAIQIYQSLRSDHPHRSAIQERVGSEPERILVDLLVETRDWSFREARGLVEEAGLRLLHAVNPVGWRPERVFDDQAFEGGISARCQELTPCEVSELIDVLDPAPVSQDLQLYACRQEFQPTVPIWPTKHHQSPKLFEELIPHSTGIARPLENEGRSFSAGRVLYRTVSGAVGELDRLSNLMFLSSDGRSTIGEINFRLAARTRASDNEQARRQCWINLADSGLIILQPASFVS